MSRDVEVPVGMLDPHLPECSHPSHVQANVDAQFCHYCVPLRACEARVLEGRPDPGISEKQAIANHAIYRNGYAAGVQAARDAVAALRMGDSGAVDVDYALAAIDALKGDANG